MRYKNYKNEIFECNFGVIIEGKNVGKFNYVEMPEIKQVEIDGKWIDNEGYDYSLMLGKINKIIKTKRQARYSQESDPLFFSFQRGESTKQQWIDAVNKIKTELPYEE